MYYLVNDYRFITQKMNVFSKTSEKQILAVELQNYAKNQLQKTP